MAFTLKKKKKITYQSATYVAVTRYLYIQYFNIWNKLSIKYRC